ncbi:MULTISPECIES: hypothetical protein [Bacillaceae]|uniref:hypothetical protein n=1 Tax=Bacillaceae TaxID=186817 RepID=UPI002A1428CB|nr:hypothetical protein [Cytobacillus sp. IB215316]MDX8362484.1 hypothetical protein [Cytobacillus sp. IB215316]
MSNMRKKENKIIFITKGYAVTIPKKLRDFCNMEPGQVVDVYYSDMWIEITSNRRNESLENQVVVGSRGSIYIPKEIRKFTNINESTKFKICINENLKSIKLIPFV